MLEQVPWQACFCRIDSRVIGFVVKIQISKDLFPNNKIIPE